jgi:hypothetical protein
MKETKWCPAHGYPLPCAKCGCTTLVEHCPENNNNQVCTPLGSIPPCPGRDNCFSPNLEDCKLTDEEIRSYLKTAIDEAQIYGDDGEPLPEREIATRQLYSPKLQAYIQAQKDEAYQRGLEEKEAQVKQLQMSLENVKQCAKGEVDEARKEEQQQIFARLINTEHKPRVFDWALSKSVIHWVNWIETDTEIQRLIWELISKPSKE